MKKHDKCAVYWLDISAPGDYWVEEDESSLEKCVSRGFFVKETEIEVCIAQTIIESPSDTHRHYGGILSIPRGAVVKIEVE